MELPKPAVDPHECKGTSSGILTASKVIMGTIQLTSPMSLVNSPGSTIASAIVKGRLRPSLTTSEDGLIILD